jgi:hypothetical protein
MSVWFVYKETLWYMEIWHADINSSVSTQKKLCAVSLGFNSSRDNTGILSSPPCPDRLWSPPSLLSINCRGFFPSGKATGA